MSMNNSDKNNFERAPVAEVRSGRNLSVIWVVPIVAMFIGGWLALKAWSEQGPVITIAFETAEGLEANKTKIKFNDVEIGLVSKIELSDDLEGVVVTAEMKKDTEKYMRENTRFWVVRARVAAGEVSGLGTLFSGVYIGCNPSTEGKSVKQFRGLEKPPVVTTGMPGQHFLLEAENLGSLDVGSPVYYRGVKVGQVVEYGFDELVEAVNIRVFVNAPFHEKVHKNTRFWNASGIDLNLDTEGVSIDTQSLVSILLGGVAFDLPSHMVSTSPAEQGQIFQLYDNHENVDERSYSVKQYYLMYFDQNVRGLAVGAPVEIRGIRIGEVVDIKLEVNVDDVSARVAVLVLVEPERIDTLVEGKVTLEGNSRQKTLEVASENVAGLVSKGLRAQLKNGNLLTGQLYVDFDFYPETVPVKITQHNGYSVLPTLPAPFEQITQRVNNILKKVERLPLEEIGADLHGTIKSLQRTLAAVEEAAGGVSEDVLPELKSALGEFQSTMSGLDQSLGPDSGLSYNARNVLDEMTTTLRSLRTLIDYVESNPQAIIFGKEAE